MRRNKTFFYVHSAASQYASVCTTSLTSRREAGKSVHCNKVIQPRCAACKLRRRTPGLLVLLAQQRGNTHDLLLYHIAWHGHATLCLVLSTQEKGFLNKKLFVLKVLLPWTQHGCCQAAFISTIGAHRRFAKAILASNPAGFTSFKSVKNSYLRISSSLTI